MRSKSLIPATVFVALAAAGCGSAASATHATGSPSTRADRPSMAFHVQLLGAAEVPPGAPQGRGGAVIATHDRTLRVCWRFAHLKHFTKPTYAHIHIGDRGKSGAVVVPLSTGARFLHRGCVTTSAAVIRAIETQSQHYYVNIRSVRYRSGAVRGQL